MTMKNAAKVVKNPHMYKSTEKKVSRVRQIVEEWYEPGRQDRCKLWVYRNKIQPLMGISERTFFRCLRRETEVARDEQPTLFDFMDETS